MDKHFAVTANERTVNDTVLCTWLLMALIFYVGFTKTDNMIVGLVFFALYVVAIAFAAVRERNLESRIEELERKDGDGE